MNGIIVNLFGNAGISTNDNAQVMLFQHIDNGESCMQVHMWPDCGPRHMWPGCRGQAGTHDTCGQAAVARTHTHTCGLAARLALCAHTHACTHVVRLQAACMHAC